MNVNADTQTAPAPWMELIKQQIASLQFGVVQIVVHDRRVVQIERTEKFRFEKADPRTRGSE